jgi:hypothetical protein
MASYYCMLLLPAILPGIKHSGIQHCPAINPPDNSKLATNYLNAIRKQASAQVTVTNSQVTNPIFLARSNAKLSPEYDTLLILGY